MDGIKADHVQLRSDRGEDGDWHATARPRRCRGLCGAAFAWAAAACAFLVLLAVGAHAAVQIKDLKDFVRATCGAGGTPFPIPHDDSRERCNGHGMLEDGACRCDDCWSGALCSDPAPEAECVVDASSGTPYLFEDYWLAQPEAELRIRASYHIGYGQALGVTGCGFSGCPEGLLEQQIRKLHADVGNFDTEGWQVVLGTGSTQLITGAVHALSDASPGAARGAVWAAAPYYSGYKFPTQFLNSSLFEWQEPDAASTPPDASSASGRRVVEFVTSPNNPDGAMRRAVVGGPEARAVVDSAYYWPHFTPVPGGRQADLRDGDVALFTLSKLTGHAGSRVGWALVKDEEAAQRLRGFVAVNGGVPRENQLRALKMLQHAAEHGYEILAFARDRMQRRWAVIAEVLGSSACYRPQQLEPAAADVWSGETYTPAPAYLWLECLQAGDCFAALGTAGIKGRSGPQFGAPASFARVELLMSDASFAVLERKMRAMEVACTAQNTRG